MFGCFGVQGREVKHEKSPTKLLRRFLRSAFHAFGIALEANSLPSAKARLASDLPSATR